MRRSQKIFTLLRIQFESANQKKLIFGRYQSYKRRKFKKSRVALGTRMGFTKWGHYSTRQLSFHGKIRDKSVNERAGRCLIKELYV